MFEWSAEKIAFMRDAAAYTPFGEALARRAAAYLPPDAHLCDAGCGIGYLTLALARRAYRVTAVDTSDAAIAALAQSARLLNVRNVEPLRADAFALPDDLRFDGMTFCFFGEIARVRACVRAHCRGAAGLRTRAGATHRVDAREAPIARTPYAAALAELDARGIAYRSATFELDMGQPFRTIADAARFSRLYARGGEPPTEARLRERLVPTDSPIFPYYLPAPRPIGLIALNAAEIPNTTL